MTVLLVFWWQYKERTVGNYWNFFFLLLHNHLGHLLVQVRLFGPGAETSKVTGYPEVKKIIQIPHSFSSFSRFSSSSLSAVPLSMARARASLSRCFCSSASARSFSASSAWNDKFLSPSDWNIFVFIAIIGHQIQVMVLAFHTILQTGNN